LAIDIASLLVLNHGVASENNSSSESLSPQPGKVLKASGGIGLAACPAQLVLQAPATLTPAKPQIVASHNPFLSTFTLAEPSRSTNESARGRNHGPAPENLGENNRIKERALDEALSMSRIN
jgi:hypothetical protein